MILHSALVTEIDAFVSSTPANVKWCRTIFICFLASTLKIIYTIIIKPWCREKTITTGSTTKKAEISITDLQGKILYKRSVNSTKGNNMDQLPVRFLARGQYMIRLATDKEVFVRKFVKQ